ncbi:MAG: SusD/RagB family nutrient-binding outer membrane lipoprotein, partial [Bacteroidota bacterium]|nr:SusD/RagB family nutrient-binding outer membrane lipoprotein [Bacteroidota bacterium]
MKNTLKYLFVIALVVGFSACTDQFEEVNTNVNRPTIEQAAPDMLLTNSIESMTDRVHEIFLGHEMGSCWVQHMAKVQYTDEDRYIPRVSVINNTWTSLYAASGMDVATIIDVAEAKDLKNYKGIA